MSDPLDGPGRLKMATLDEATLMTQRLHGLVERMAAAAGKNEGLLTFAQQIKRAAAPLVTLLKPQFGLISEHVAQMLLITSRSGSDKIRVRALREGVGQLKVQLEAAANRVKEVHTVKPEASSKQGDV
ncbi:MAG: hypothetical protein ACT4R6_13805 [Gemmatimonadaceae bacterium]